VKAAFPDHDHTLYNGETLRGFIENEFDREVVSSLDRLRPYSYKADLGRSVYFSKKAVGILTLVFLLQAGLEFPIIFG
jgi:hypothetical protein